MNNLNLWNILGLNASEQKIMQCLTKLAKNPAIIARHTGVSKTTLSYTMKKLHKRNLVFNIKKGKKVYWKSNLPKIFRYFASLRNNGYGKF